MLSFLLRWFPNPLQFLTIGFASTCLVLATLLYLSNNRLDSCRVKGAELKQQVLTLEERLDAQNRAVDDLKKASNKAQEASRKAIQAARTRSEGLGKEIDSLKAQKAPVGESCQAGEAVSRIRQGLK